MKLLIEDWGYKNLTENAVNLMEEAVMCYKVGAYRSAYMMSYLAFKVTVRERVLKAARPDCITEKCWDEQILRPLKNDNKWEEKLNTLVLAAADNGQGEHGVFRFTNYERIRNRYEYWKNVRNSCAHAKDEHITSATVEQFWNYMQDDLPLLYVLGGKQYLVEKLYYSYNYFQTVGRERLENVLKDISIVYKKGVKECFEKLYEKDKQCLQLESKNIEFWEVILCGGNEIILEGFLDFYCSLKNAILFVKWYQRFPHFLNLMISRHKEMIQETLAPYLEASKLNYEEDVFWHLLVEILKFDDKLIDINKVTMDYNKLKMIGKMNLNEEEIEVLHKNKVFQKLLLNAGEKFFKNDAESHSSYYSFWTQTEDADIELCFQYVEWDVSVIEKLNIAISELERNCESRYEPCSKERGVTRKEIYKKIVCKYKENIEDALQKSQKDIREYEFVSKLLD